MRIVQYNIQSLNSKKELLKQFLMDQCIDICLLNETWLKDSKPAPNFPNYNLINLNSINTHNGVGILIRDNIKFKILNTQFYEVIQNIAILVETGTGYISILCVYCPPNSERFKYNEFKMILNNLPRPCIIAGDFNAHHSAFGCMSTSRRGDSLYDLINELDFCVLNTGHPTTVSYPNRNPSAIDISFVSPVLAPLCEWRVHDDPMGSYHYPTFINVHIKVSLVHIMGPGEKFLYNKTDWNKYCEKSKQLFQNVNLFDNLSSLESYNTFCTTLNTLRNDCVNKFVNNTNRTFKKPAPWWNNKCTEAVKNSRDALHYYKSFPTIPNFINYKKLDALKKRVIKQERKSSWERLCTSFNRDTPISRIWNYIKKFKRIGSSVTLKQDDWIPAFLNKLSDNSNTINITPPYDLFASNNNSEFLNEPFTIEEFCLSLQTRKDTTPGLDNIPYILLKNLHKTVKIILLNILNNLWTRQKIPESWKTQCVIPILKPNKPPNVADSYRPISLSSCIGKLFENMIKTRLDWYVEANNLLPHTQFGFRKGRGCTESIMSFLSDIKQRVIGGPYHAMCVFLDVQGAFDNVDISVLIKILHDLGISGHLLQWLYNFLSERTLYVKYNNVLHGPRMVNKGTMQGATLSPLIYNLYTSQILKYINTTNVSLLQFADDILIYCVGENLNEILNNINSALSQLFFYYNDILKISINANKSSVLTFSKKTFDITSKQKVIYNNLLIPHVKQHKFLGIIIDNQFKFDSHIQYVSKRALQGLNVMKYLTKVFWGSDPKILSMLYKSIVRSHIDYSTVAIIYIKNKKLLYTLDKIQNSALRLISGAMMSTPINSMEVETCIMPLSLRRLLLINKLCVKLLSVNNNLVLDKILPFSNIDSIDILTLKGDNIAKGIFPNMVQIMLGMRKLSVNMNKVIQWQYYTNKLETSLLDISVNLNSVYSNSDFLDFMSQKTDFYKIYTDGSKTNNATQSAYYDSQTKIAKCFKIDPLCSIFTAEAYAIYKGLLYTYNLDLGSYRNIIVISDSMSVLMALKNKPTHYKCNYLILNIRNLIYDLITSGKVTSVEMLWIKSHSDITGNVIVDKIVTDVCNEDNSELFKVPFTDYFSKIKEEINVLWHNYWIETLKEKGKWYYKIQNSLPVKPWYDKVTYIERDFITIINRMRFGHCLTPMHLARLKIINSSDCPQCSEKHADLEHIVFKCKEHTMDRLILVAEITELIEQNPTLKIPRHITEILQESRFFIPLYKYVKNTLQKL